MKKSRLANKINAAAVALGLSILPAEEVDSGVSYGGSIGVDLNKNISLGGYVSSTDRSNSFYVRGGLNYILIGRDKGNLQLRVGGGYNFNNRIAPSVDLSFTPKSESPFSIGAGLGYSLVKKDGGNGNIINGGVGEEPFDYCTTTGGTWTNEEICECPEGKILSSDECVRIDY